ncbi:MAG: HipA domain-containing protein [Bacteroidia bacterium]|nr:HipA domain-containing protein [Bacteroidia bacterium]
MKLPQFTHCPGTLAEGFSCFSRTALNRVFQGKKVSPILPYDSPDFIIGNTREFDENRKHISISGVQEKFSVLLEKNKLRLTQKGEQGTYILKPIPSAGKRRNQMPTNEHVTMQLARQVYGIETAENALLFFQDGSPAYITKRFDVKADGTKWAQDNMASLAQRTPQSHGDHYKYLGNYQELFVLLQRHLPSYKTEAPKLFKLLLFNFLFSNGDAHLKNFSILETSFGDYRLSPAYDLLNSRIHVEDNKFALEDGLLPKNLSKGKIGVQFAKLAELAGISPKIFKDSMTLMLTKSESVEKLVAASFLDSSTKRSYIQLYQGRLKELKKG